MILSLHMITGAVIGSKINKKATLVLIFAFLSHFILDFIPHFEYTIKPLTLFLDLSLGAIIAIAIAYKNPSKTKIIIAAAFIAILPDTPALARIVFTKLNHPNLLNPLISQLTIIHNYFHTKLSFMIATTTIQIILLVSILLVFLYFIKTIIPKLKEGNK